MTLQIGIVGLPYPANPAHIRKCLIQHDQIDLHRNVPPARVTWSKKTPGEQEPVLSFH